MKKNRALYIFVALACIAAGAYFAQLRQSPTPPQSQAVEQLLSQNLKDASGQDRALAAFRGKPLLVNFWATWCAPCVEEMPELSGLQAEIRPAGIQIIGIGIDSPSNIAEFGAKYNISYPLLVGGLQASELTRQLGNQAGGLPFTVLVGRDGSIKKTYLGRLKMDQLRQDLKLL